MRLERLFENLTARVEAIATCRVAEGWRLRLPALDHTAFHFVLEGAGAIRDNQRNRRALSANSLAVVPAGHVHRLECGEAPWAEVAAEGSPVPREGMPEHRAGPAEAVELAVACGRLAARYGGRVALFGRLHEVLVYDFSDDPRVRAIFRSLLAERRAERPGNRQLMSALMSECVIHLLRRVARESPETRSWLQALEDPYLADVVDDILSRPGRPHSVDSLASTACLSRSAFAERFRERLGETPMAFVRKTRLRRAAALLRRKPPPQVGTVAKSVGYSRSHFSRLFNDHFGCTPTEYRGSPPGSGIPDTGGKAG